MQKELIIKVVLLFVLTATVLGVGVDRLVVQRQQELRILLTARHMAEGGSWLVPEYDGRARLQKPPLMYWVVGGLFKMAHKTDSVLIARVPAIVFGTLFIGAIALAGALLVGRKAAMIGAVAALSSLLFQRYGRVTECDVPLALFTSLAVVAAYYAIEQRSLKWWIAAGASAGVGFMTKGLAAIAMPVLAIGTFACLDQTARRSLLSPGPWLALVIFAVIAAPWYAYIWFSPAVKEIAAATFSKEVSAVTGSGDHAGPFYYYLARLPVYLLPWGLLLPFALWNFFKRRKEEKGFVLVLCWFISSLVLLSILHNKQQHYSILLLFPSALLIGGFLKPLLESPRVAKYRPEAVYGGLCALMVIGSAAYLFSGKANDDIETAVAEFADYAGKHLKPNDALFYAGRKRGTFEFYTGHKVIPVDNLVAAWAVTPSESCLAVVRSKKHPYDIEAIPGSPVLMLEKNGIDCALFRKP